MDQAEQLRKMVSQNSEMPQTQAVKRNSARVITITSGKGGVGKSSVSVNLAIWLSRLGNKVIILDADFGLANIEVMLGIRPKYNLADLMFNGLELKDIITPGPENIGFISGGSGIQELTRLNKDQIIYLTKKLVELDGMADIIIIDTGAGIADSVLEFVLASTEVLLVATPEPTSITDAYALLKTLNRKTGFDSGITKISVIANRVVNENDGLELYNKLGTVVSKFLNINISYLGEIPMDSYMSNAVMQQKPVTLAYPDSKAGKAFVTLAGKLSGSIDENKDTKKGIAVLFTNLIKAKIMKRKKTQETK